MVTLKLKKSGPAARPGREAPRPPVRGAGVGAKPRPTLAQAQAERSERDARYQEQLRQRFGDRPPTGFVRRDEEPRRPRHDAPPRVGRDADPSGTEARGAAQRAPAGGRRDPRPAGRDPGPAPSRFDSRDAGAGARGPVRGPGPGASPGRGWAAEQADPRAGGPRGAGREPRHDPRQAQPHDPRQAPSPEARRDRGVDARADHRPERGQDWRGGPGSDTGRLTPAEIRARYRPVAPEPSPMDGRARKPHDTRESDEDDRDLPPEHAPGSLRLSKRMSELGISSRREADEWIAKGWVRVDDQVVSELGSRVLPGQRITVDAKAKFQQAQRVTVLIHKPVGYVSGQAEDGYEPAVVLVTPNRLWAEDHSGTRFLRSHLNHLVPAGRLDIDSVGLLVLTQDGRVAKQLIGEDTDIEKEYLVRVAMADGAQLPGASLALLRHGLELDGEALRPALVEWVNEDQLRFVLRQGKKRQIRRMCEAVGLQVLGLKRVRIGQVMLGDLPAGQWRYLRADESFG